jgi:hypothetical protein
MAAVTIHLPTATEQMLRKRAARDGTTLESYLLVLIECAALTANGALPTSESANPAVADMDHWLNELADGLPPLPTLPTDFSRADLYAEHD